MTTMVSQCLKCLNYIGEDSEGRRQCQAFAEIPRKILFNEHDHTKPYGGENERAGKPILFEGVES